MTTLTLRTVKGSPLTNAEVDSNFVNLSNDIQTLSNQISNLSPSVPLTKLTGDITAAVNTAYYVDTAGYTVTLPTTTSNSNTVQFVCAANVTIAPGTSLIEGNSDSVLIDVDYRITITLKWVDSTTGWVFC